MSPDVISLGRVTLWTGWDVRGATSGDIYAADAFAKVAPHSSGKETRFELIAVAARGFRPPRFLSIVDLSDEGAAESENELERTLGAGFEGFRQTWSLLYRCVAATRAAIGAPYAIYLLGVNPPGSATDDELTAFNDFYTNVHLPEVAIRRHALRAVRYELVRELRPPYKGAPRSLAAYELDEEAASIRRHVGPPYAAGPEVWQLHTTPWRLWYRRLAVEAD